MASHPQQGQSNSSDHHDDNHHNHSKVAHDRKHKLGDQDQGQNRSRNQESKQELNGQQSEDGSPNSPSSRQERSQSPSNKFAKSVGKSPNSVSPDLRKEQNRAAQRAFRDRKERYLQQLENMIKDLKEQQFLVTTRFQQEVKQLKSNLEATVQENFYLREVVFAFETALCKGGYVAILQDVKLELYRHHYEKQQSSRTTTGTDSLQQSAMKQHDSPEASIRKEPPHPLTLPLSKPDSLHEVQLYTTNRDILYKAPPLFVSVAPEDGKIGSISSPLERLSTPRPAYAPPGTHLPKHTEYAKHPTVFDELQSSLFPPGTLESLLQNGMATPQEVVNDEVLLFDDLQRNGEDDRGVGVMAYASKMGLTTGNHRLQKEFNILASAPPATDPNISPQIYELSHDPRIDLIPCPKLRAQMILHHNKYNHDELFKLLVDKAICHGSPLDVHSWELPDEFFDRFGFLMGLDMERLRRKNSSSPTKIPSRSKMSSGTTPVADPAQASSTQAASSVGQTQAHPINIVTSMHSSGAESSNLLGPSSPAPIHTRSHPFLRKLQSAISAGPQPAPGAVALGASAFSTSSSSGGSSGGGRKSVDEAIAAVGTRTIGDVSPTLVAANATDAIITRRLSNLGDDQDDSHHHQDGCCSGHKSDSNSDTSSHIEPMSVEARRFTETLLGQNKAWAKKTEEERPGFFAKLEKQQKPQVLWIGCSDSRVPANQIVNLDPGEIFVHRNIANVVTHTDMNLLSVLEYAVDVLKVRHIIICGHYGCGGVAASLTQKEFGIIDNWLRNIKDLYTIHRKKFDALPPGSKEQHDLLTELNVIQSALNVCHTSIIQKAWSRGAEVSVHGWCYRLSDGVIRNLGLCIEGPGNVEDVYQVASHRRDP
ncbi:hypothetical protein BGX27_007108 [Mortierella sp. AM989]|nr:hypothetical protein BGX27_007108 [Mortierella sp. AM989]